MMDKLPRYLIHILTLCGIYFIAADFGLRLDAVGGFATLVWLPTGISLAAILIFGYKLWPAVFLGAFITNYTTGAPWLVALGIAVGNTLEALWGALLLNKFAKFNSSFRKLSDAVSLIFFGAGMSTLISATIGTSSLLLGDRIPQSTFPQTWFAWWVGDMISNLTIAPMILVWSHKIKINFKLKKISEEVLAYLVLAGVIVYVFTQRSPLTYLIFPPLIWISLRFSPRSAVSATFIVVLLTTVFTVFGYGPFSQKDLSDRLLYLQGFMSVIAVTTLIMTTVSAERKRLERLKDEFIGFASHEFKTPITSLKIFSSILKRSLRKGNKKQSILYLSRMELQIERLTKLISDLLEVSKIQVGKLDFNKTNFSLKLLLNETIDNFSVVNKGYKIKINGSVGKKVYGDRQRIEQVMLNLLSNAVKYSPSSKNIDVNIRLDTKYAVVGVQDRGIGISEENLQRVFDRFYRVTSSKTKTLSGFGIGLYLSSQIIKEHGGKIWVESKPNKGTTFYFTLPLKADRG